MADPAVLAEAYRRNLLPPDQKAAYEEAHRRGILPAAQPSGVGAVLSDAWNGLSQPFVKLGHDVIDDARNTLDRGPTFNPVQMAINGVGDLGRTARSLGDVAGLASAPFQAVTNPIAGAATRAGMPVYSSPKLSLDGGLRVSGGDRLAQPDAQAQINQGLLTALSAVKPSSRAAFAAAARPAPAPASVEGVPANVARQASAYVAKIAQNAPPPVAGSQGPQLAAEALGKRGQVALGALARRNGQTADALEGVLSQRASARPDRILDGVASAVGIAPEAVKGDIEGIVAAGQQKAAPLFKAATDDPSPVMNDQLQGLSRRPVVQAAMKQAYADLMNAGKSPEAEGIQRVNRPVPGGGSIDESYEFTAPTASTWDKVYKAIGGQVERHPMTQKVLPDSVSPGNFNVNVARGDLRSALGEAMPVWDTAMKTAGEYMPVKAAFEAGGKFMFEPKTTAADFGARFAKLSPAEQDAWRGGIANSIYQMAQNGKLNPALLKTPALQQKAIFAFGHDGAGKLTGALESEKAMLAFERRYAPGAGSVTSDMNAAMAEQDSMHPAAQLAMDAGANMLRYGPKGGIAATIHQTVGKVAAGMKTAGLSEAARDEAGRQLMMSPEEFQMFFNRRAASAPAFPFGIQSPRVIAGIPALALPGSRIPALQPNDGTSR